MANAKVDAYIRAQNKQVDGWLARSDGEIFSTLLQAQIERGIRGAVVEIGVHHGKTFIPMALSNDGQRCYAIDIFGRQDLNRDASGHGDKAAFLANLNRFGLAVDGICIDERLSTSVTAADIEHKVGKVRFFHVDGGHDVETVVNDLVLARAVLVAEGVIAIDDAFRPEWPEVSMGLFSFLAAGHDDFVPFAIGFNKTYLCRRGCADGYRDSLAKNDFLTMYFSKRYAVSNDAVLVFQRYPLPEWTIKRRMFNYLTTYHPDLAFQLRKVLGVR
jgi:hypothetical protein